jgi:hypothetical protein
MSSYVDADWADASLLALSMAAHPAGKGHPQDNQAAAEELLRRITTPPPAQFEDDVADVMFGLAALLSSKQADYGPGAINNSPGGPLQGINVRMHDKMSRAVNLTSPWEDQAHVVPRHESLRDTYRDLANYAVIAVMVLDGTWPSS